MQISRKRSKTEAWYQLPTDRKWPMMTSLITSRDPERSKWWPSYISMQISPKRVWNKSLLSVRSSIRENRNKSWLDDVVTNAISICLQYQTDFTTLNDPSSFSQTPTHCTWTHVGTGIVRFATDEPQEQLLYRLEPLWYAVYTKIICITSTKTIFDNKYNNSGYDTPPKSLYDKWRHSTTFRLNLD